MNGYEKSRLFNSHVVSTTKPFSFVCVCGRFAIRQTSILSRSRLHLPRAIFSTFFFFSSFSTARRWAAAKTKRVNIRNDVSHKNSILRRANFISDEQKTIRQMTMPSFNVQVLRSFSPFVCSVNSEERLVHERHSECVCCNRFVWNFKWN